MADIDPAALEKSGIDPDTGAPLSQSVRSALKTSTLNLEVFKRKKEEDDRQSIALVQAQQATFNNFGSSIESLRNDIGKLGTSLNGIALLLQKDGLEEQNRIRTEQENEKRLADRQVRIGKESAIEKKIQNAIVEPVQKLAPKLNDVFGSVGTALGFLFGGWLTKQTIDGIKAQEEGNAEKFNEIKFNILKNVGIVAGGFLAIKAGFGLITRTIANVALGLGKLLIAKPLSALASTLRLPGTGNSKPSGGPGIVGGILNGFSGVMNFLNEEYVDTALAALTFVPGGGIFRLAKIAAGTVFTLDNIAEFLGSNLTGANPELLRQKRKELEDRKKEQQESQTDQAAKPATPPTPATPEAPPSAPAPTPPPAPATPAVSTPSAEMVNKFEMAWKYKDYPLARGRIEGAWAKMTNEEKQQAIDWAKSKGHDWKQMRLPDIVPPTPKVPAPIETPAAPQPSVTMIRTGNNQEQQPGVPITYGPLTSVPLISSANPDNFYVLYSQVNYNVVI
jgi:DNA-binding transcriptional MerR regulator